MSQTYRATGINLKSIPLGESDRILTILTREFGLIRAVAPGARKPKSKLGGRSELFVVNDLLLSHGRSLDKLSQAESIESYPRLSRDLAKLTVSQYWAEIILYQTPSHEPNVALFDLICQRLTDLVLCDSGIPVLIHLIYGIAQLLNLAGVTPQLEHCCLSGQPVYAETIGNGRVIFSANAGGVVLPTDEVMEDRGRMNGPRVQEQSSLYTQGGNSKRGAGKATLTLSASELTLMQRLFQSQDITPLAQPCPPELLMLTNATPEWLKIEQVLRSYVQYHTERFIRSAALLDSCFPSHSVAVSALHP
jgi:DNA repair protein RecO (recombination protein O)